MDFIYQKNLKYKKIIDESYGVGYFISGKLDNKPALAFLDLGLSENTKNPILRTLSGLAEMKGNTFSPYGETRFFQKQNNTLAKIHETLIHLGYLTNPYSRRSLLQERYNPEDIIPLSKSIFLTENLEKHIKNRITVSFGRSGVTVDPYRFQAFETTKKGSPFVIYEAKVVSGDIPINHLEESKESFPEMVPQKFYKEGSVIKLGMFLEESFLKDLSENRFPLFPPDIVDGYQKVEIVTERKLDFKLQNALKELVESGAIFRYDLQENQMSLMVPCCYERGGVSGRAFESRYAFLSKKLSEVLRDSPVISLTEKYGLEEVSPRNIFEGSLSVTPPVDFAFFRKLEIIKESVSPNLFPMGSQEVFMLCEQGNYLAARNGPEGVVLLHGVEKGKSFRPINEYIPSLLELGK